MRAGDLGLLDLGGIEPAGRIRVRLDAAGVIWRDFPALRLPASSPLVGWFVAGMLDSAPMLGREAS